MFHSASFVYKDTLSKLSTYVKGIITINFSNGSWERGVLWFIPQDELETVKQETELLRTMGLISWWSFEGSGGSYMQFNANLLDLRLAKRTDLKEKLKQSALTRGMNHLFGPLASEN